MPMKTPPHPGHSIKDACLDPLGLSVTEGAKVLGVARQTLSRILNGQSGISAEMAIRPKESRLVERRPLAAPANGLRSRPGCRQLQDRIKVKRLDHHPALCALRV